MTEGYRTRFAPTPSGVMHWGHARTHLVTWLRARASGGRIVMRFDDLDTPRVLQAAIDDFLAMHEWLGLDFDEGPIFQSSRKERYHDALERLQKAGRLYACTCSRSLIEAQNPGPAGDGGLRYLGTCRDAGHSFSERHAARLRWEEPSPGFEDRIFGAMAPGLVHGDFVLKRADGVVAYHLASVVDDLELGVTEVVRGEDLLLASARQLLLIDALDGTPPDWLHVPLVYDHDGQRLAKSYGSPGLHTARDAGLSPEAALGALAHSLRWLPAPTPTTLNELLNRFTLNTLRNARGEVEGL